MTGPHHPATTRLVNFSDAVVAIAATLLILPLVEEASSLGDDGVAAFLGDNSQRILVFVLSFVVISRFWLVHHTVFKTIEAPSRGVVWANSLWLLSIVFLPFPTEIIGSASAFDPVSNGLYIGTMLITAIAELLLARLAHQPLTSYVVTAVAMAAALLLAVLIPPVGLFALLLLLLSGQATRIARRIRER